MTVKRVSIMMPGFHLEDMPRGLVVGAAAEMLSAWTALWHPAFIGKIGELPGWHAAEEPPDPAQLDGELIVIPPVSRQRLPADWWERMTATTAQNPLPVMATASRARTVADALEAGGVSQAQVDPELVSDFLALGYAHLQLELLTRTMQYHTVLYADGFRETVVAAARMALAGDGTAAKERLVAAFDLLMDARNHFYAVDFYLVDVTLLAESTLGAALKAKLATERPTNLLMTANLIEQLAAGDAETLAVVQGAVARGAACVLQGPLVGGRLAKRDPEGMLAELVEGRAVCERVLGARPAVYGQYGNGYSPMLPEVLAGLGFRGALHTSFDGSRVERPRQPRARWGVRGGEGIDVLSTLPSDVADPGTWLNLGEYVGGALMRDHVATVLLAGWPGHVSEYYEDLRRIAKYGPLFGRFVTLEEYFRTTESLASGSVFQPTEYEPPAVSNLASQAEAGRAAIYVERANDVFDRIQSGLARLVGASAADIGERGGHRVALNPWSVTATRLVNADLQSDASESGERGACYLLPETPGLGFAVLESPVGAPRIALAEGCTLRNEILEVVVSEATGGIQSLRTHRDRRTRVSQRLVMHDRRLPQTPPGADWDASTPQPSARMVAERVEISQNDRLVGEIKSHGQLVNLSGAALARFEQRTRVVRGLPLAIVDVRLSPEYLPEGDGWSSYFASRIAWREEAVTVRCGVDWTARETTRRRIESAEWIEIADFVGPITCFALGLPYHRLASDTWLDTLLFTADETRSEFRFAIGLGCEYPSQSALAFATAGRPGVAMLAAPPPAAKGWFLHVDAKSIMVTHLEPLPGREERGVRLRLLETEGRDVVANVSAFRAFTAGQRTNFLGEEVATLPVVEGKLEVEIGAYRWVQVEAEW